MFNSLIYKLLQGLPAPFRGLAERFDDRPIESPDSLSHFVRTRSSYIAQTALYGYLKTRMGTRYRQLFEDDVFSHSLRIASAKVFASCLSDLAIYCIAPVVCDGGLSEEDARRFAEQIYREGIEEGLREVAEENRPEGVIGRFQNRLSGTRWEQVGSGLEAFDPSGEDLVRFAPVGEEFKELDAEIVRNSIHLRWGNVRDQWEKRMRPSALAASWTARSGS